MKANVWNAVLFAGKREICVLSILVMMFTGIIFNTPTKAQWAPTAPVKPSDLAVASDGGNALMLIWDDNSDNEDNFVIERKIGTEGTFSTIVTLPAETTKWRDDNTANLYNTPYIYQIKAVNNFGESKFTLEAGAVTEPAPTTSCQIVIDRDFQRLPTNPAPPLPFRFQPFRDDLTNLRMMRITDEINDGEINGTAYSYWTTFNANNTRIFIINGSGNGFYYTMNPQTFRVSDRTSLQDSNLEVEGLSWSNTNPDIVYATHRQTNQVMQLNVSLPINQSVQISQFDPINDLRRGRLAQMTMSEGTADTDAVFSWELQNACRPNFPVDENCIKGSYFFTWKRSQSGMGEVKRGLFVENTLDVNGNIVNEYNEMHVSKNGEYLFRALDYPERRQLFESGNSTPTPTTIQYVSHFDLGKTFLVGDNSDSNPPRFFRINYADILTTPMPPPTEIFRYRDYKESGGHISLLANDEGEHEYKDYALVSNYTVPERGQGNTENIKREIFMIKTGTGPGPAVKRLAHHYSVPFIGDTNACTSEATTLPYCYKAEPRANISRDGKFVAFTSNWGVFNGRKDVFILKTECPQQAASPTVALGGRVTKVNGAGMWKARVTLLDSAGNTRIRETTSGGYYSFTGVPVGTTTIIASKKMVRFTQPMQTMNAIDDLYDIYFTQTE